MVCAWLRAERLILNVFFYCMTNIYHTIQDGFTYLQLQSWRHLEYQVHTLKKVSI